MIIKENDILFQGSELSVTKIQFIRNTFYFGSIGSGNNDISQSLKNTNKICWIKFFEINERLTFYGWVKKIR